MQSSGGDLYKAGARPRPPQAGAFSRTSWFSKASNPWPSPACRSMRPTFSTSFSRLSSSFRSRQFLQITKASASDCPGT